MQYSNKIVSLIYLYNYMYMLSNTLIIQKSVFFIAIPLYLQLLHAVTGSMAFCTPEGGEWHPRLSRGCHFPLMVYKTHGLRHSLKHLFCYTLVTLLILFSKFCCHLQTLLRWSMHSLVSRRTVVKIRNHSLLFPRTHGCFVIQSAGNHPSVRTIKVMYTSKQNTSTMAKDVRCA